MPDRPSVYGRERFVLPLEDVFRVEVSVTVRLNDPVIANRGDHSDHHVRRRRPVRAVDTSDDPVSQNIGLGYVDNLVSVDNYGLCAELQERTPKPGPPSSDS